MNSTRNSKTRPLRLLLAALLTLAACAAPADEGGGNDDPAGPADTGDFVLTFEDPAPEDAAIRTLVEESGIPGEIVDTLNTELALPEDISVVFAAQDDGTGPYYDPEANLIAMPYPSLRSDREILEAAGYEPGEDLDTAVLADMEFTLYHEIGHALIANLEIPVTGREEDAVDTLAAVMITQAVEGGGDIVLTAADWFAALAADREEEYSFAEFADEHSLDEQRFASLVCLVYGSDPDAYADVVGDELLPPERAERCPFEYEQAVSSWDTLLGPHLKD